MHKILLIDKDLDELEFLKVVLEEYEVTAARTAAEGLACAKTGEYSLIFLDGALPEMEEFGLLKELQRKIMPWHIPVLLLLDETDAGREEKGLALGAADYIVRPLYPLAAKARARTYVSLYQYRKNEKAQSVMVDSLTGVASRKSYEINRSLKWQEAVRLEVPVSFCVIDIDKFRTYNERYGYPAGDKVLISAAEAASSCLKRGTDLFARYGGDRFAAAILGGDAETVFEHQKKICKAVEKLHIPHWDSASRWVTASIGGVTVIPGVSDSCGQYFQIAEDMLAEAKKSGGNQVVWMDEKKEKLAGAVSI